MKMSKILSLVLAVLMLVAAFAGCTKEPTVKPDDSQGNQQGSQGNNNQGNNNQGNNNQQGNKPNKQRA